MVVEGDRIPVQIREAHRESRQIRGRVWTEEAASGVTVQGPNASYSALLLIDCDFKLFGLQECFSSHDAGRATAYDANGSHFRGFEGTSSRGIRYKEGEVCRIRAHEVKMAKLKCL